MQKPDRLRLEEIGRQVEEAYDAAEKAISAAGEDPLDPEYLEALERLDKLLTLEAEAHRKLLENRMASLDRTLAIAEAADKLITQYETKK